MSLIIHTYLVTESSVHHPDTHCPLQCAQLLVLYCEYHKPLVAHKWSVVSASASVRLLPKNLLAGDYATLARMSGCIIWKMTG